MKKTLPEWLKQEIPDMEKVRELKQLFQASHLNTVCQEAHCPNMGTCWQEKVATFMILGNVCTRNCRFCAVQSGTPSNVNTEEPYQVAQAVKALQLKYVVITSVTRDDLMDEGAAQFVKTINSIREVTPKTRIEVLIPDLSFHNMNLTQVIEAKPEVIGHNIETVERIFQQVRPQAEYARSLNVLKKIKEHDPDMIVKSGFMVGLGETESEIQSLLSDLFESGCDIVTIGQYLSPSQQQNVIEHRFVSPEEFETYKAYGEHIGIKYVMSGPKVRSSFLAEQGYGHIANSILKV